MCKYWLKMICPIIRKLAIKANIIRFVKLFEKECKYYVQLFPNKKNF